MMGSSDQDINLLNIDQQVAALCAGRLNLTNPNDILVVGTPTNLLAYDVHNNTDVFYKDVRIVYTHTLILFHYCDYMITSSAGNLKMNYIWQLLQIHHFLLQ